ncbi:hypothetical protein, partial [Candidatus Brachybacter algidus]|uniref:hypothetical protein n=1 Tax=Candidatus Brachybacter algidus TaxID=2982024 RepID=UPI0025799C5F
LDSRGEVVCWILISVSYSFYHFHLHCLIINNLYLLELEILNVWEAKRKIIDGYGRERQFQRKIAFK